MGTDGGGHHLRAAVRYRHHVAVRAGDVSGFVPGQVVLCGTPLDSKPDGRVGACGRGDGACLRQRVASPARRLAQAIDKVAQNLRGKRALCVPPTEIDEEQKRRKFIN